MASDAKHMQSRGVVIENAPSSRKKGRGSGAATTAQLSVHEVQLLIQAATYYQRAMGPVRLLVRLTAPAEIKSKYRFIADESKWLKQFAQATLEKMKADGLESAQVSFTPAALIAFWGRLLTQLNSRRSWRRMSRDQAQERAALAAKLQAATSDLRNSNPEAIEEALETRRPAEVEWMREKLLAK